MKDALSSEFCWFSREDRRNGDPLSVYLHQPTGIAGGTGPTGSIKARSRRVMIPRSRFASHIHKAGTILRVVFLCMAVFWLITYLAADKVGRGIVAFLLILAAGSLLMHFFYRLAGVCSKVSVYRKHPQIHSLIREGLMPGSHPFFHHSFRGDMDGHEENGDLKGCLCGNKGPVFAMNRGLSDVDSFREGPLRNSSS